MRRLTALCAAMLLCMVAYTQNTLYCRVTSTADNQPLTGVVIMIEHTAIAAQTNTDGYAMLTFIPPGTQTLTCNYVGFISHQQTLVFPRGANDTLYIALEPDEDLEEIIISSTRSSRTIDDEPTRVETISGEELEEKSNMKPGDIRMVLAESTGIQVQQTSATSYNAAIRIQGLDGRYTQLLRDGMPLYSGYSGGLSLLQVPPLDLRQVEVIKGAASTLYGGGAIAGLINLVSKTPGEKPELRLLLNGTSAKGADASAFYSQRYGKMGLTLLTSYHYGTAYDPAGISLSALPQFNRIVVQPHLFVYFSEKSTLRIGFNATDENRLGGDMRYIDGDGDSIHRYYERNLSKRFSTQAVFTQNLHKGSLQFKNSLNYFNRDMQTANDRFKGLQTGSFSEASYLFENWIGGLNLVTDRFNEDEQIPGLSRDYNQYTAGAFLQNTWSPAKIFSLESGLRGDYHSDYGWFLLPRISSLFRINKSFTSRIGAGTGYKTPTIFTEEAERVHYANVLPIDIAAVKAEYSYGANADINYTTAFFDDALTLSINQLFYYTRINNALALRPDTGTFYSFYTINGLVDTRGAETNIKLTYGDFKLFIGYSYTNAQRHENGQQNGLPLVATHRFNNVLMYEVEEKWKIGAEAYYFSPQRLSDGTTGKAYWICGFMAEKLWEHVSVFINFENFMDTRQTRFGTIYTGSISNPVFKDIYAPLDGFVINGGIKLFL